MQSRLCWCVLGLWGWVVGKMSWRIRLTSAKVWVEVVAELCKQFICYNYQFHDYVLKGIDALNKDQRDQIWIIETETKTENVWVSITRLRLKRSDSQWRDRDQYCKCVILNDETETDNLSLNDKTETKTEKVWVSETRLGKICWYEDPIETLADIWLPISGEGNFFEPWNEFFMVQVFWLVGLDFIFIWCYKKQT